MLLTEWSKLWSPFLTVLANGWSQPGLKSHRFGIKVREIDRFQLFLFIVMISLWNLRLHWTKPAGKADKASAGRLTTLPCTG